MTRRRQSRPLLPLLAALIFTGAQTSATTARRGPDTLIRFIP